MILHAGQLLRHNSACFSCLCDFVSYLRVASILKGATTGAVVLMRTYLESTVCINKIVLLMRHYVSVLSPEDALLNQ